MEKLFINVPKGLSIDLGNKDEFDNADFDLLFVVWLAQENSKFGKCKLNNKQLGRYEEILPFEPEEVSYRLGILLEQGYINVAYHLKAKTRVMEREIIITSEADELIQEILQD